MGHSFGVIEEPPRISPIFYYECTDLLRLPFTSKIQKIAQLISWNPFRVFAYPEKGCPPYTGRIRQNRAYNSVFNEDLKDAVFVSFFSELCQRKEGLQFDGSEVDDQVLCQLPVDNTSFKRSKIIVLSDPGSKEDLRHISYSASYYLSEIVEKQLFGSSTLRR